MPWLQINNARNAGAGSQSSSNHQPPHHTIDAGRVRSKPPSPTRLALQMVHEPTQHGVLALASRTMVDLLLMHRTAEMLVEDTQIGEPSWAKVASKAMPVPRRIRSRGCGVVAAMVLNHLVCEDVVPVDFSAVLVYFAAVDTGRAAAGFEMESGAREVGKFVGTPGAFDVFANVDGGSEVL